MSTNARVVGKNVAASVGLRVVMQPGYRDQGVGTVTSVHANGGYVSVRWDNGSEDKVLFTGQQGDFYLMLDPSGSTTSVGERGRTPPPTGSPEPASIRQRSPSPPAPSLLKSGRAVSPVHSYPLEVSPSPQPKQTAQSAEASSITQTGARAMAPILTQVQPVRAASPPPPPLISSAGPQSVPQVPGALFVGGSASAEPLGAARPPPPAPLSGMMPPSAQMQPAQTSAPPSVDQSQLQKQLLAQEVVKLRKEVAELRAKSASMPKAAAAAPQDDSDPQIKQAKLEIATLEAQKAEVVAQANAQKALLAKEVKHLRAELEASKQRANAPSETMPVTEEQTREVVAALQRRKEFEENFTRTLRDLRKELEQTSLKHLSTKNQVALGVRSMIQLSNERIEKVMEEAAQVPVEERLHIEALRLLVENSKLRKTLNDYSEGILHNTLSKIEGARKTVPGA